jgi:hypothetical protein
MGGLNQPGAIEIRTQGASPEVMVGPLSGLLGKSKHRIHPGGNGNAIQAGKPREAGGHSSKSQILPLQPTGIPIFQ